MTENSALWSEAGLAQLASWGGMTVEDADACGLFEVADASQIYHDLTQGDYEGHLLAALTSIRLKKKGVGKLPSPQFAREMERTLAGRIGHARYLRSVWSAVIEKFGGSFQGKRFQGATAEVQQATVASLLTEIIATVSEPDAAHAKSAQEKLFPILQEAVDFVADDMLDYAMEKLQEAADSSGF